MRKVLGRSSQKPIVLYFCIFLLFLDSMGFWIGWNDRKAYIDLFLGIVIFFQMQSHKIGFSVSIRNLLLISFLLVSHIVLSRSLSYGYVLGTFFPAIMILLLDDNHRACCLQYIFKWFAYLMIPSIIVYLLVELVGLPSLGQLNVFPESEVHYGMESHYLIRDNYLFFTPFTRDRDWERFCGPFVEPGHLGMMLAFLLFSTGFQIKKNETKINLVALLLTMSLAGYLLTFLGYLFIKYERKDMSLIKIMSICFVLLSIYLTAIYYKDGNNLLNEKVVSRLEYDEENIIVGNNRVHREINLYLARMYTDTKLLLTGYDDKTITYLYMTGSTGTGIKMWLVKYGLIGTLMAMMFYIVELFYCKNRRYVWLAFVFVFLMFYQRSYPFWHSWIICYTYGLSLHNRKEIVGYKKLLK